MTTDQVTVAILGAGSWGTTFAKVLADAAAFREEDITIRLWARRDEVVDDINTNHANSEYLDDIVLPETITATSDAKKAVRGAELVVVAVQIGRASCREREQKDVVVRGERRGERREGR